MQYELIRAWLDATSPREATDAVIAMALAMREEDEHRCQAETKLVATTVYDEGGYPWTD